MKSIKTLIILAIFILYYSNCSAQLDNHAIFPNEKQEILYTFIDNPIIINTPAITKGKLLVSISNGTISGDSGKYVVNVKNGKESIISVSVESKSGEILKIGSKKYKIRQRPDVTPCLGNNCGTNISISKEELIKSPEILLDPGLPFEYRTVVTSLTISYIINNDLVEHPVKGNKFTQQAIEAIENMATGQKIYIEKITYKAPDGIQHTAPTMIILLTKN